jgi:cytochrome c oxidase cbb3-type subunit IV
MDVNDLRSTFTVLSLLTFVGIVAWAWARGNKESFEQAARLPLGDEEASAGAAVPGKGEVR